MLYERKATLFLSYIVNGCKQIEERKWKGFVAVGPGADNDKEEDALWLALTTKRMTRRGQRASGNNDMPTPTTKSKIMRRGRHHQRRGRAGAGRATTRERRREGVVGRTSA
mmetsp:Transcript_15030/g.32809  ORF Transcript_15030/g.32809 Transcript_15030/m.32809 type:complete len:111 (-) Transcript_15030:120-452(-)